jgi:hypothetical protein
MTIQLQRLAETHIDEVKENRKAIFDIDRLRKIPNKNKMALALK